MRHQLPGRIEPRNDKARLRSPRLKNCWAARLPWSDQTSDLPDCFQRAVRPANAPGTAARGVLAVWDWRLSSFSVPTMVSPTLPRTTSCEFRRWLRLCATTVLGAAHTLGSGSTGGALGTGGQTASEAPSEPLGTAAEGHNLRQISKRYCAKAIHKAILNRVLSPTMRVHQRRAYQDGSSDHMGLDDNGGASATKCGKGQHPDQRR